MGKILFSEQQRRLLEANPNVNSVSDRSIQYKPEFKVLAVNENQSGKGSSQVFIENGFVEMIGTEKAKESLSLWRKSYQLHGEDVFFGERRRIGSTDRPSTKGLSPEEKPEKAEARIKDLEAQVELLKKLVELQRQAKK